MRRCEHREAWKSSIKTSGVWCRPTIPDHSACTLSLRHHVVNTCSLCTHSPDNLSTVRHYLSFVPLNSENVLLHFNPQRFTLVSLMHSFVVMSWCRCHVSEVYPPQLCECHCALMKSLIGSVPACLFQMWAKWNRVDVPLCGYILWSLLKFKKYEESQVVMWGEWLSSHTEDVALQISVWVTWKPIWKLELCKIYIIWNLAA